jgi:PH/SEC7 domain-containing protein
MQHFSERYYECNPQAFPSDDAVHGLSIATLLLNTDLHTDHGGRKMSSVEFSDNLGHIGVELPRHILKEMYESIKKNPLQWAVDDPVSPSASGNVVEDEVEERVYHVTIPGTFVQAVLPGSAPVFKEGFVMKKNIMEAPHKKVSRGKRHWKAYYAYLKGFLLYFAPPQGQGELHLDDTSSAITVTHCLAMRAHDYHKKSSVVRVTTADWHVFLLQATDVTDMQQWIGAINSAAALYSSPPLAAPIGSQAGFHRPTFPLAPTRNSQEQQIESHEVKVKSLEKEAKEHQARKPTGKNAKHGFLEEWFDQYEFLQFEINRFRIYLASLCSDTVVDFNAPLPSGLIPSPSISTLHNPDQASGESDFLEEFHRHGHTSHIVGTPPVHRVGADFRELQRHSPVFSRKPQFEQL